MIERAVLTVFLSLAALGAVERLGESFHPISIVNDRLASISCESRGWSASACKGK